MKQMRILSALGQVEDRYIEEAARESGRPGRPVWVRWAAAACLCVAVGLAAFGLTRIFSNKAGPTPPVPEDSDSLVQEISALSFNGAYYEATDIPEALQRYGLPPVLTRELAGEHLSYLAPEGAGYRESAVQTEIELLEYAPAPCRGVYIVRDGDRYLAALFCNIFALDDNTSTELTTLYEFYGIGGAGDLASIAPVDWNRNESIGRAVTDREELEAFYELSTSLPCYGNDDFQSSVFDGIPEERQAEAHTDFANDLRVLRLETTNGLLFYLELYPSYGWIYAGGTLSYYQMDGRMTAWLAENLTPA